MRRQLGIFAISTTPGDSKSPLATTLGIHVAAEVEDALLQCLLGRFGGVMAERVLLFWPPERRDQFASLAAGWELRPQSAGDRGRRMWRFFQDAFAAGAKQAVLLAPDCPTLPRQYLEQAFVSLERHAVVLGLGEKGGWYLVGASGSAPPIFHGVDWGTPRATQQTMAHIRAAQLDCVSLPSWYQVMDAESLHRLGRELEDLAVVEPHWRQLDQTLRELVTKR